MPVNSSQPVSYIIKYRNRKLYDLGKKTYVHYIDIFYSIKEGRKIIVRQHKPEKKGKPKRGYETLPDITQSVLIGLIRKFILPKYDNKSLTKIIEVSLNKSNSTMEKYLQYRNPLINQLKNQSSTMDRWSSYKRSKIWKD